MTNELVGISYGYGEKPVSSYTTTEKIWNGEYDDVGKAVKKELKKSYGDDNLIADLEDDDNLDTDLGEMVEESIKLANDEEKLEKVANSVTEWAENSWPYFKEE